MLQGYIDRYESLNTQGPTGATGATGPAGPTGHTGSTGSAGGSGVAEYIYTTQSPNNSIPPGTAFTISTLVFNNISSTIVASAGAGGTVFTLNATGVYSFDFETSLGSAGSIGLYTGASAGSLALDVNTVVGSSTATTWIHGRAIENVTSAPLVVAVSSVTGTAAVVTAGTDASSYMIRVVIVKLA